MGSLLVVIFSKLTHQHSEMAVSSSSQALGLVEAVNCKLVQAKEIVGEFRLGASFGAMESDDTFGPRLRAVTYEMCFI